MNKNEEGAHKLIGDFFVSGGGLTNSPIFACHVHEFGTEKISKKGMFFNSYEEVILEEGEFTDDELELTNSVKSNHPEAITSEKIYIFPPNVNFIGEKYSDEDELDLDKQIERLPYTDYATLVKTLSHYPKVKIGTKDGKLVLTMQA